MIAYYLRSEAIPRRQAMQQHAALVTKPLSAPAAGSVISLTLVTGKCLAERHVGEKFAGSRSNFSR